MAYRRIAFYFSRCRFSPLHQDTHIIQMLQTYTDSVHGAPHLIHHLTCTHSTPATNTNTRAQHATFLPEVDVFSPNLMSLHQIHVFPPNLVSFYQNLTFFSYQYPQLFFLSSSFRLISSWRSNSSLCRLRASFFASMFARFCSIKSCACLIPAFSLDR